MLLLLKHRGAFSAAWGIIRPHLSSPRKVRQSTSWELSLSSSRFVSPRSSQCKIDRARRRLRVRFGSEGLQLLFMLLSLVLNSLWIKEPFVTGHSALSILKGLYCINFSILLDFQTAWCKFLLIATINTFLWVGRYYCTSDVLEFWSTTATEIFIKSFIWLPKNNRLKDTTQRLGWSSMSKIVHFYLLMKFQVIHLLENLCDLSHWLSKYCWKMWSLLKISSLLYIWRFEVFNNYFPPTKHDLPLSE